MDTTAATSLLDDQLREDLSNLNSFDETRLVALVDLILSFLLDPQGTDFTSGLGSYAETHRSLNTFNYYLLLTNHGHVHVTLPPIDNMQGKLSDSERSCKKLNRVFTRR